MGIVQQVMIDIMVLEYHDNLKNKMKEMAADVQLVHMMSVLIIPTALILLHRRILTVQVLF